MEHGNESRAWRGARWLTLACCGLLLTASPAGATQAARQARWSADALVRGASFIVEGAITATEATWTPDHTQIHTVVTLDVAQCHKGDLPAGALRFGLLGGTAEGTTMMVIGQPSFQAGERLLLFLRDGYDRRDFPVVGMESGKLAIHADRTSGAEYFAGRDVLLSRPEMMQTIEEVMRPVRDAQE